jgi:drug/metabolite transporter (DMT)-like permease
MKVFDTSFLDSEANQAPPKARRWIWLSLCAVAMTGAGAFFLFIALHVVSAAGAAGGCGGG